MCIIIGCNFRHQDDPKPPVPQPVPVIVDETIDRDFTVDVKDEVVPQPDLPKPNDEVAGKIKSITDNYLDEIAANYSIICNQEFKTVTEVMNELTRLNVASRVKFQTEIGAILKSKLATDDDKYNKEVGTKVFLSISKGINDANKE
jgi:hypothetical protein